MADKKTPAKKRSKAAENRADEAGQETTQGEAPASTDGESQREWLEAAMEVTRQGVEALDRGDFVDMETLQRQITESMGADPDFLPLTPGGDVAAGESEPVAGEMEFARFVFRDGLNITVRRGDKWHGTRGLVTAIAGRRTEGEVPTGRRIRVVDTIYIPFFYLGEGLLGNGREYHCLLQFQHDPDCRNYYRLLDLMRELYPADTPTSVGGFSDQDWVTVVFFVTEG